MQKFPSVQNVELYKVNNTNDVMDSVVKFNSNGNFIQKANDYSFAISKFTVPISSLEIMRIEEANDPRYAISLMSNIIESGGVGAHQQLGTAYMPTREQMQIQSPNMFLEAVNRTFAQAYQNLITGSFPSFVETVTDALTFNSGVTLAGTLTATLNSTTTAFVNLKLENLVINTSVGTEVPLVNIHLENPVGSICQVANAVVLATNSVYEFSIAGYYDQSNIDDSLTSGRVYQPLESFLKFNNETTLGGWILHISPCGENTLDITLDATLTIGAPPKHATDTNRYDFPQLPPNLSLDDSGYFLLQLHEKFVTQRVRILLGSVLNSIISLLKNPTNNQGYIDIPITLLSSTKNGILSFKSESPRMYSICQIIKLMVISNSLPINKDLSLNAAASLAITSFDLDASQLQDYTVVSYASTEGLMPSRRYRMNNSRELSEFDLKFAALYFDGTTVDLTILPNEFLSCTLSFYDESESSGYL